MRMGWASVTFIKVGKAMVREAMSKSAALEPPPEHVKEGGAKELGVGAMHAPALVPSTSAKEELLDRHWQAVHAGLKSALMKEQQHPPRHWALAQSKLEEQGSPGGRVRHAPVCRAQALHPALMAFAEQHAPPRHSPRVQEALRVHAPPGRIAPPLLLLLQAKVVLLQEEVLEQAGVEARRVQEGPYRMGATAPSQGGPGAPPPPPPEGP